MVNLIWFRITMEADVSICLLRIIKIRLIEVEKPTLNSDDTIHVVWSPGQNRKKNTAEYQQVLLLGS